MKAVALMLVFVGPALYSQAPLRLFPCQIVDVRISVGLQMKCFGLPQESRDFASSITALDANGAPTGSEIPAMISLVHGAEWSQVAVNIPLTVGTQYRLSTFAQYAMNGANVAYVPTTFDFDYPPKVSFPCQVKSSLVVSPTRFAVRCDAQQTGSSPMTIAEIDGKGTESNPQSVTLVAQPNNPRWMLVDLPTGQAFASGKSYRLYNKTAPPSQGATVQYKAFKYEFEVNKKLAVVMPYSASFGAKPFTQENNICYFASTQVAVDPASFSSVVFSEDRPPMRHPYPTEVQSVTSASDDYDFMGTVRICIPSPGIKSVNSHVVVTGLRNRLGDEVSVGSTDRLILPGSPKGKDDAMFYAKLLSQAGPGAKPGWAADVKFAPVLFPLGMTGFFFNPNVTINIGWGTVKDNKVADLIHVGLGATRAFQIKPWQKVLPLIQATPQMAFETDREGHHQNLLFDGDAQFWFHGWRHSIKDKNARILASRSVPGQSAPDITDIGAKWGWQLEAYLGTEVGSALSSDTVKSADKSSSVDLPTYTIARLRPRFAATLEIRKVTFSLSVVPRYLFDSESVTRETNVPLASDPTKQSAMVYLWHAQGFRPYGEAGVAWQFDRDGHISISTTYKLGSLPPNFDKINTVQTGLQIVF